ncbi:hypothetical protein CEUSTIGMA_g9167.t1 [Chlamydomonas eustigma]|uniref:Uncharacterized protein n=1 Tax=Chlamydomonas eustigma TaxID=1157962 RepID=A0A250XFQ1_9CHLO|nr:hypothetical protein CEUSTIGMA_g9167.t1 [Chlamydomonas eustigma]|eukprot:GAX81739.1 hypothetical protein CEUSTIGMA_g9167.t1 [Chlamydomonas eustigma]
MEQFSAEQWKRIIDADLAVMSQEGKKGPAKYTERAVVSGYMPPELATHMWSRVNLTDIVFVKEDAYIPVTYTRDEEPATFCIAKGPSRRGRDHIRTPKPIPKDWVYISAFDPKHGRAANKALYPTIIKCLKDAPVNLRPWPT